MTCKVYCPNCKKNNLKFRQEQKFEGYDFLVPDLKENKREWFDCIDCNLTFSIPRLTKKQLEYMYDNYRSESFRGESPDKYFDRITNYPPEESENFQKIAWIKDKISLEFKPDKILDIGSGGGVLLHSLGNVFIEADLYGVEPTTNFAELSRRRTRAEIINGFFDDKTFIDYQFNLITCCQVLEHIESLNDFVENVSKRLTKGGYLYIEVPDISDFKTLEKTHSRFSEPSHLWYFNADFLCNNLFKNILLLIDYSLIKTVRNRNNLMILFQKD